MSAPINNVTIAAIAFLLFSLSAPSTAFADSTDSYEQGKRLLEAGRYEEAARVFQLAAADTDESLPQPASSEAAQPQGLLRQQLGRWHAAAARQAYDAKTYLAAIAHAQRAASLDPSDKQSKQLIAKAQQALKRQQNQLKKAASLAAAAQQAEAAGKNRQAVRLWKQVLKEDPQDAQASQALARLQNRWETEHPPVRRAEELKATASARITHAQEYRVSIGDVLEVFIWQQPDLSRDVVVRPDGRISFPLVGDVAAVNTTLEELDSALTERLRTYVKYPDVSLAIKRFGGTKTILLGEVQRPGIYVPTGDGRVLDIIAMAGGFTSNANQSEVMLIRGGVEAPQLAQLNLHEALSRGALKENVSLQPNDILVVAKQGKNAWRTMVDTLSELNPIMAEILVAQSVGTNFGMREFQRTGRETGIE